MLDRSPFPGMDPYLEAHWGDVHQRLVTYAADQFQPLLPGGLRARMEERVYLEDEEVRQEFYPDVRVVERSGKAGSSGGAALLTAGEPLVIEVETEPVTESFIEIIDTGSGNRVVTVLEVLSPEKKRRGKGGKLNQKKQKQLRRDKVSLVEIDLLRGGRRALSVPVGRVPPSHRTPYQVCVTRGWKPGRYEVYRVPLQAALPTIKVPLRQTDADVSLNLQALIEQAYRNGRYDDIDYRKPPEPPLDAADAAWAEAMLQEKGMRG